MVLESVTPAKPDKLSEGERRNRRLDLQADPARPGFQYPGSPSAAADSISAGLKARPSSAGAKKPKSRQERIDELRDKIASYENKAEGSNSDKARKIYLEQSKNFQQRLERLLYREEDPEKVRAMLAQWEGDKSLPESVRKTMIAKILARLGETPEYAKIKVDQPDGTVIKDPEGNLYVVRNGRLVPKEG